MEFWSLLLHSQLTLGFNIKDQSQRHPKVTTLLNHLKIRYLQNTSLGTSLNLDDDAMMTLMHTMMMMHIWCMLWWWWCIHDAYYDEQHQIENTFDNLEAFSRPMMTVDLGVEWYDRDSRLDWYDK